LLSDTASVAVEMRRIAAAILCSKTEISFIAHLTYLQSYHHKLSRIAFITFRVG
jgi:hypothetical protein